MSKFISIPNEYRPAIEELPGELGRIAEHIEQHRPGQGVDLTLFLAQIFRGQNLYIRNVDFLLRRVRNDAIRMEYDQGTSVKALATKWGLSTRMVEKILAKPGNLQNNQLKLF